MLDLGSSKLINLVATVALQDSTGKAKGFVASQDPTDLSKLLAPSFGVGPDKVTMNPLTVPQIGDAVASFGIRIETSAGTLDGVILFFARGRVNATLLALGAPALVDGDDVAAIGQIIDQRIRANSPP